MATGTNSNDHLVGTAGDDLLYGLGGDDVIEGQGGNDTLDGGTGADRLVGGAGDDLYYLDNLDDKVLEASGEGNDRIDSLVSYSLAGQYVEILRLLGSADLKATGNNLANTLEGNDGANILNGAGGADAMAGGLGNDRYIVDNVGDTVTEASASGGTDRVDSAVSFTLGANVENLILTGNATITATGNALANVIVGNNAGNLIDGGAGADQMEGKGGNDRYIVDNVGDKVLELADGGNDTIDASISYSLAGQYVETLRLTGSAAINGTGNNQDNVIQGNDAANVLTGSGGNDKLVGNGGNDTLDGGTGTDNMFGGAGDDIYVVDVAADSVTEAAGEGSDLVKSAISYTLGANVEALALTGTLAIDGTGNGLANVLTGNNAANLLNGGAGADTLTGGLGADRFAFTTALGAANIDTITDFGTGADKIVLAGGAGQPFAALATGALSAESFRADSRAFSESEHILYNSATGALLYDADGVGGAAAVQFAKVAPGTAIDASSFIVTGAPNVAPVISSAASVTVAENISTSTIIYTAAVQDTDGDAVTLKLANTDGWFTWDKPGQIRFTHSPNYEVQSSYSFTIIATDSSGTSTSKTVSVSVTDVAEATYAVAEKSTTNETRFDAQDLQRDKFSLTSDPTLTDDSLPSAHVTGNISTSTDVDFYEVWLNKGEQLILDVEGTTTLDSLVKVYRNADVIAENDDLVSFDPGSTAHEGVSHNMDSYLKVRATESGYYTFSVQALPEEGQTPSSGAYAVNVSIGPVASAAQITQENVEAVKSGVVWDDLSLSYGFTTSASQYGTGEGSDEIAGGFSPLNATQKAVVRTILGQYAGLTNLSFTEATTNPGGAQLRYALTSDPDAETAHAYYPGTGDGGDSWYNAKGYLFPKVGNYEFTTFIHETGHALGLKHGHESPAVSTEFDSMEYTVMTYRSYVGASSETGYTNETWGYAQTPMMYDIAALQQMYGADFTLNATDSVYTWNATTAAFMINGAVQWTPGANRVFMTLWDGGGTDTYDLSNYTDGVKIDLRPGEWTSTSIAQVADLGDGHFARGNIANALQFGSDERSLIENAIGGVGADVLTANAVANKLTGGGGSDTFTWASAADSAVGEADTVTDFLKGTDKIDLRGIDAISSTEGANDAFTFIGNGAFNGHAGELRVESSGGAANVYGDVTGDGVADFHLILTGAVLPTGNDFYL